MLVEMGKSGTPALLLCELLLPALAQRLDLLSPMRARVGRIMLARKKKTPPPHDVNKSRDPTSNIGGTVLFFLFSFSLLPFFLDQPCADGGGAVLALCGFFYAPSGPARSQEPAILVPVLLFFVLLSP